MIVRTDFVRDGDGKKPYMKTMITIYELDYG
jgi:hypothetical protein